MDFLSVIEFWLLLALPLLVVRQLFPQTAAYLPLGGSDFNQNAILLMIAVFICGALKFSTGLVEFALAWMGW
jgi:hypothetical protein